MELRSTRRHYELMELQSTLSGLGFYESGMDLQEMRQLVSAIQLSISDNTNHMLPIVQETEFDLDRQNRIINSTMMNHPERNIDYIQQPRNIVSKVLVRADVHHAFEDSPARCSKDYLHSIYKNSSNINRNDYSAIEDGYDENMIMGPVTSIREEGNRYSFSDSMQDNSSLTSSHSGELRNVMLCSTSSAAISDHHDSDEYHGSEYGETSL